MKYLLFPFVFVLSFGRAQTPNNPPNQNVDYFPLEEISKKLNLPGESVISIFDLGDSLVAESGDSSFYNKKAYMRAKWHLQDRVGGDLSLINSLNEYKSVVKSLLDSDLACEGLGDWISIGPEGSEEHDMGSITAVWTSSQNLGTIIIGTQSAGMFKTTDFGQNWVCVTDQLGFPTLGVHHIVSDPLNSSIMYAASGTGPAYFDQIGLGVLKSYDNGESWAPLNSLLDIDEFMSCSKIVVSSTGNDLWALTDKQIYYSNDNGMTFNEIEFPLNTLDNISTISDIEVMDNGRLFVCTDASYTHDARVFITDNPTSLSPTWIDISDDLGSIGVLPVDRVVLSWAGSQNNAPWVLSGSMSSSIGTNLWSLDGFAPSLQAIATLDGYQIPSGEDLYLTIGMIFPGTGFNIKIEILDDLTNPQFPAELVYDETIPYSASGPMQNGYDFITSNFNLGFVGNAIRIIITTEPSVSQSSATISPKLKNLNLLEPYPGNSIYKLSRPKGGKIGILCGGSTDNAIAISSDYGNTWDNIPTNSANNIPSKSEIALSDVGGGLDCYAAELPIYQYKLSNNYNEQVIGGSMNVEVNNHIDARSIIVFENTSNGLDYIFYGNDGGITYSDDGGATFKSINGIGLNTQDIYGLSVGQSKDEIVAIGNQDNNSKILLNNGWIRVGSGDGGFNGVDPLTNRTYTTDEGGKITGISIVDYNNGILGAPQGASASGGYIGFPLEFDWENTRAIQGTGGSEVIVYKITDPNPNNWTIVSNTAINGINGIKSVGYCAAVPEVLYASQNENRKSPINSEVLFKSIDEGQSWTTLDNSNVSYSGGTAGLSTLLLGKRIMKIQVCPNDANKVWISISGVSSDHEVLRVLYSENGGGSWIDYSEGLPGLPVTTLEYYRGSDDLIFAGNDIGVYYRDRNMNQWECFSKNLPKSIITDLDINYCTQMLYASTFGRGVYKSPIPFTNNKNHKFITANEVWDEKRFLYENVVVASGAVLTITNTEILIAKDRKITIEPGAAIIIDNATLTNDCGEMWAGIVVEGNSNLAQNATNQGRLIVQNNSLIEHARNAVRLVGIDENGGFEWNKTGGYVQATNSTFRNNKRAAEFMSYHNDFGGSTEINNLSYFNNCSFETTDDLFSNEDPYAFITMYNVTGVGINGNKFVNTANSTVSERGAGIITADARYVVKAACNVVTQPGQPCPSNQKDPNVFTNLNAGIVDWQFSLISDINVSDAIFNNCTYGLKLGGSMMHDIYNNTFNIYTGDYSFPYQKSNFGIYSNFVDGFKIEGNQFNNAGVNGLGQGRDIGIASGWNMLSSGEIYRNEFIGLETGTQSYGANLSLAINCNTFDRSTGTISDIYASGNTLNNQGFNDVSDPFASVSNVFIGSCSPTSNSWQIFAESYNQVTNSYQALPFEYHANDLLITGQDALCTDNDVALFTGANHTISASCPDKTPQLGNGGVIQILKSEYNEAKLALGEANLVIDGGDTENLLTYILNTSANWQIKNELLQYSPYLSDEVLIAMLDKTPVIADWVIDDILEVNAPLSDAVIAKLINRNPTLPDWILVKYLTQSVPVASESLIDFIELSPSDWVLKDVLIANSPLYDEELIALIEKLPPSKDWVVRDVLVVNTPLSQPVWDAFYNHSPAYPSWVENSINSSSVVAADPSSRVKAKSNTELVQEKIEFLTLDKNIKINRLSREFLRDNLIDSVAYYLDRDSSLISSCILVPIVLRSDTLRAQSHLSIIRNEASIKEVNGDLVKADELNKFCDYYELALKINKRPGGLYQLTDQEAQQLQNISMSNQTISINAEGALQFINNQLSYDDVPDYPLQERSNEIEYSDMMKNYKFEVYPNPFDDNITILNKNQDNITGKIDINIYTIHGKLMERYSMTDITNSVNITLNGLVNGIYLIEIKVDDRVHDIHKLIKN